MLFSATLPEGLAEFASAGLREPELVRLDTDTRVSPMLRMCFLQVRQQEKLGALLYLMERVVPASEQAIVFMATKHAAELTSVLMRAKGHDCSVVYGAMDQTARRIQVAKFRARSSRFMFVTDVASRGIDLPFQTTKIKNRNSRAQNNVPDIRRSRKRASGIPEEPA